MKQNVKDFQFEHLFFFTATTLNKIRLFDRKEFAVIVLQSLNYMRENQWLKLYAFVIMPNHLHMIFKAIPPHTPEQILRDFRKYTAQQILKIMKNENHRLLSELLVNKNDRKYQIWKREPNFKNIYTWNFLKQKTEYIHNNPINKGWRLANNRWDYKYSSAIFYDRNIRPLIEIDDLSELLRG